MRLLRSALPLLVATVVACGDDDPVTPPTPPPAGQVLASVSLPASSVPLTAGQSATLAPQALDSTGAVITGATGFTFTSSDPAIAEVSGGGLSARRWSRYSRRYGVVDPGRGHGHDYHRRCGNGDSALSRNSSRGRCGKYVYARRGCGRVECGCDVQLWDPSTQRHTREYRWRPGRYPEHVQRQRVADLCNCGRFRIQLHAARWDDRNRHRTIAGGARVVI